MGTEGSCNPLTGGASPSSDVAEVIVGKKLARGRQRAQLNVGVQTGLGGQTQQGNVIPEVEIHESDRLKEDNLSVC